MTEIRPIRHSEGRAFLELLCDVFSLDFNRAVDVFFAEPLYEPNRKWALFEGREMVSILTTTPLIFGWGRAFGIAGVATRKDRQGQGHASQLIQRIVAEGERIGERGALLFAKDTSLYERNGFEPLDHVVRAEIVTNPEPEGRIMESEEIEILYDNWARGHSNRLRRDARRWAYWQWNYRVPTEYRGGYLCHETSTLREGLFRAGPSSLPLPPGIEWLGTSLMTDQLQVPIRDPKIDLYLMGRNVPGVPQMFMTDQF